ncbi:MAG: glycosyltransferase family 4 protein [Jatrophihabitans sp.]|uniref:glycosyltransferase family 4 protein n=1 Tax=Jatrophihabitans sp. TaxID=1932789 RepID=UPI003F8092D1
MVTHPRFEYVLVGLLAAAITFLLTPLMRVLAVRIGAVANPRDRDVHAMAIPRLGGVAMFGGVALALLVASQLPSLQASFRSGPEMGWVVLAAAIICALGVLDDKYELDSLTKLAGQVLAAGIMVTRGGTQLAFVYVPFGDVGTISLGGDIGVPVTILLTLVTINALNFIDGLDGLAAGVTAISAGAMFVFSYHLSQQGYQSVPAAPTLLAALLVGACLGFLPHNFYPAKLFMGDSGSMLLGLLLSASTATATTQVDPQAFTTLTNTLPLVLPLLIPVAVLAVPFIDLLLAVVRRVSRGRSPFAPDKQHLHHRLLELGHSQRRAVVLLYIWSALLASFGVGLSYTNGRTAAVLPIVAGVIVVAVLLLVVTRLQGRQTTSDVTPLYPVRSSPDEPVS